MKSAALPKPPAWSPPGRIADILCRYMDDMERIKKPVDITLVALHVSAIGRAARAEDDDVAMGDAVAQNWRRWWPGGWRTQARAEDSP